MLIPRISPAAVIADSAAYSVAIGRYLGHARTSSHERRLSAAPQFFSLRSASRRAEMSLIILIAVLFDTAED